MKLGLCALGLLATSGALMIVGCTSGPGTGDPSSASSSATSSSSGTGGSGGESSTSSSSTGTSTTSSSSSSSSSGSGAYTTCSECTSETTGAYTKECKTKRDACLADADCVTMSQCASLCSVNKDGGCCTRQCAITNNTPMASQTLFYAMDNCIYCETCKMLCDPDPGAGAYCAVTAPGGESMCM